MDWLANVIGFLQGKKTYLVCAAAILTALLAYMNGTIDGSAFIAAIFAAVSQMTLKAGQNKIATATGAEK